MAKITIDADASRLEAFAKRGGDALKSLGDVSENRLGNQLERLTRRIGQAQTAGDALAATASAIEKVFSIGMGGTIAIAAGVSLYEMFKKNGEAVEALEKKSKTALTLPGVEQGIASVENMVGSLGKIRDVLEEVETRAKKPTISQKITDNLQFLFSDGSDKSAKETGAGRALEAGLQLQERRKQLQEEAQRIAYSDLEILRQTIGGNKELGELKKLLRDYDERILKLNEAGAVEAANQVQKARDLAAAHLQVEAAIKRAMQAGGGDFSRDQGQIETTNYLNSEDQQIALNKSKIAEIQTRINSLMLIQSAEAAKQIAAYAQQAEKLERQNQLLAAQATIRRVIEQQQRSLQAYETGRATEEISRQRDDVSDIRRTEGNSRRRLEMKHQEEAAKRREAEAKKNLEWAEWAKGKNSPEAAAARQQAESARLEQDRIRQQRANLDRDEKRENWRLDADMEKAKLRGGGSKRQRAELAIDREQLQKQLGDVGDPLMRRRIEVDLERNKQQGADLEKQGRSRPEVVGTSLARIGGGGYSNSFHDPVAQRVDRTNRILEQIHAEIKTSTAQHSKGTEAFDRRFTLAP